jgi:hypothetical protein
VNYLGLTVLTEDPNRRDQPTHTADRSKVRIDSVTGPFSETEKGKAQKQHRPFSWYMETRAEIDLFRAFRAERKGKLVPFWLPTWHHDFVLAEDVLSTAGSVNVFNINYTRHQFDVNETWRRHLAFIKIGVGIQFIKRIDGSTEGINTELITFPDAVGVGMLANQWMLSFLTLCRLDQDEILLHWHSKNCAEAEFQVVELPQEMLAVPVV